MGKQFDTLSEAHIRFIAEQHIYFTGSAAPDGRVNISPKGMDSLRVLAPDRIAWLNLTGSGNETAGHLRQHPRVTVMWCSFTRKPMILRAYGTARAFHVGDDGWTERAALFPPHPGARQVFEMQIDMVQSSCGYAVPFMEHVADRDTLKSWAEDKGEEGIRTYWATRNATTLDGTPTGVPGSV